jgi:hypothetical protein
MRAGFLPVKRFCECARYAFGDASHSETVNSMVKCRFGAPLRKQLDSRKETATRLKLVGHNIRRVGHLETMGNVVPHCY